MPVYRIPDELVFPPPSEAEADGLLGVGSDLRPERLLLAYAHGIFPWYNEGQPILWFSPDPRFVLVPDQLKVSRSLKKTLKKGHFRVTMDQAFERVIAQCKTVSRPGQPGTWITGDMQQAYVTLHRLGFAHSVEVWEDQELVGGLYGVALGGLYAGESMFAHASDASKVGFVWFARQLQVWGFELIDCQVYTSHLERFGAGSIPREAYLTQLEDLVRLPSRPGPWSFDEGFSPLNATPGG